MDGMDALAKLEAVRPDLAIIDIMMPRKDGWMGLQVLVLQ